jgi:hypothetical protein
LLLLCIINLIIFWIGLTHIACGSHWYLIHQLVIVILNLQLLKHEILLIHEFLLCLHLSRGHQYLILHLLLILIILLIQPWSLLRFFWNIIQTTKTPWGLILTFTSVDSIIYRCKLIILLDSIEVIHKHGS